MFTDAEKALIETVEESLPELAKAVSTVKSEGSKRNQEPNIVMTQDAFSRIHPDELTLFGMAIKYIGLHGVTAQIIPSGSSPGPEMGDAVSAPFRD